MRRRNDADHFFYPVVGLAIALLAVVVYFAFQGLRNLEFARPTPPAEHHEPVLPATGGVAPAFVPRIGPTESEAVPKSRKDVQPPPPSARNR